MISFAEELRSLMTARNLSNQDVAELTGFTTMAVDDWTTERRIAKISTEIIVRYRLGMPMDAIPLPDAQPYLVTMAMAFHQLMAEHDLCPKSLGRKVDRSPESVRWWIRGVRLPDWSVFAALNDLYGHHWIDVGTTAYNGKPGTYEDLLDEAA